MTSLYHDWYKPSYWKEVRVKIRRHKPDVAQRKQLIRKEHPMWPPWLIWMMAWYDELCYEFDKEGWKNFG